MPTLAEIEEHRESLQNLATLAIRDLVKFWRSFDLEDAARVAAELRDLMPELFAGYGLAAGAVAADFYEDLRAEAAVATGTYAVITADPPVDDAAQALVGWGLAPMFPKVDTVAPDAGSALSRLSGGLQRAVVGTARQTIITNTRNDPTAVRYARHAKADACAFCRVLATRQADYRTERSALRVTGEIDPRDPDGFPLRGPRGTQPMGEKFHDYCGCTVIAVWPGQEVPEAPYVADWRQAYEAARKRVSNPNDLNALLAVIRDETGAR